MSRSLFEQAKRVGIKHINTKENTKNEGMNFRKWNLAVFIFVTPFSFQNNKMNGRSSLGAPLKEYPVSSIS